MAKKKASKAARKQTSKRSRPATPKDNRNDTSPVGPAVGKRELVVLTTEDTLLRTTTRGVEAAPGADIKALQKLLESSGAKMSPLFDATEDELRNEFRQLAPAQRATSEDLSRYYAVEADDEKLDALAKSLREANVVEAAYVKPPGETPIAPDHGYEEAYRQSRSAAPPSPNATTPDFVARQLYLEAAPGGVDARFAWTHTGGRGAGVQVIDLEWGWRFNHEDLRLNQGGVVAGTNSSSDDHGTAVIGEISGDPNSLGVTGIAPDARISAVAFSMPTATAIRTAANRLNAGDIMLLEIHRAGPKNNFQPRADQDGYVAIEWWPDDFAAIRYAVNRGIIVVEAAGNGGEDLDHARYSTRPNFFPATWTNPFNRSNRDSGAIVVGAGAPPPGTHGNNHGADRSRLGFSNYGALIDAQGWGREVTTTGYGELQGVSANLAKDRWYTNRFSGTSSASPIVVGALACVQGILRQRSLSMLNSFSARQLLRSTGSPQQDQPGRPATQRIGNRPNLRQMIGRFVDTDPAPKLKLLALHCYRTEDFWGGDEAYLKLNGRTIFGPVNLRRGQRASLQHLTAVEFRRRVRLDLYDQDMGGPDPDDHLGTAYAWAHQKGEQWVEFNADGACYRLEFEVS